jgi:arylsulfatase A-like enzyme
MKLSAAILALVLAALVVRLAVRDAPEEPAVSASHVVLIVVDTLRADKLAVYGHSRDTSPRLAELAAEGVLFENAVAQSSWTLPSMVSLMTGRHVAEEAIKIPADSPALAEAFQQAGFATGAFIFNDLLSPTNQFHRGFDFFEWQPPPFGSDEGIAAWLAAHRDGRSFTFVHLNEVHDPYGAEDPLWPAAFPERFLDGAGALDAGQVRLYEQIAEREGLLDVQASLRHIERQTRAYDDDVAYVDARIGSLLDAIGAAGIRERTVVVVAADHGEGLWTHLDLPFGKRLEAQRAGHPTLVDALQQTHGNRVDWELVHVPLILVAPGLTGGVRVEQVVENVDLFPTLHELCGLAVPSSVAGRSLVALARRPARARDGASYAFTHTRYFSSLVEGHWQLIEPTPRAECELGVRPELYDVREPPWERRDHAAERPELVALLSARIRERLRAGIVGSDRTIADDTLEQLKRLGYVEAGILDTLRADFSAEPTATLVARAVDRTQNCLARLEAVNVLARRELSPAERAELAALLADESQQAVRAALRELLWG